MLKRLKRRWSLGLLATVAVAMAVPASASATTLWVSKAAPSAPFNSCLHPGYDQIQAALTGPGTAIHVCKGTYAEQLNIERPVAITGYEGVTIALPAVTANSTTPCDTAAEAASTLAQQDEISVCTSGKVALKNVTIDAVWPGEPVGPSISCGYNLYGVFVAGGADLELTGSTVLGAAPKLINGCQYGVGVEIGVPLGTPTGVGQAKLANDTVSGYEKNGVTVAGSGSEATIKTLTVTGSGENHELAQNGIGVQEGAKATITTSTVSGNECEQASCGSEALSEYAADGVYFYDAGAGSSVTKTLLTGNDIGVEAYDSEGTPAITSNTLEDDRWAAVQIALGSATVNSNVMRDSEVGIQLVQFAGQALGGTAAHDTIEDMSKWAVFGRSDNSPTDVLSSFSITGSKISGNPGSKPQQSVETENPAKLKIYAEKDK